jgi:hypothetical protein
MRTTPDPECEFDQEELENLKAEPWMLKLLDLNPGYTSWGPHEDYMITKGDGWNSTQFFDSWEDFGPWEFTELNECCNFYFQVVRESTVCEACDQTGYNPATRQIAEDWYDFDGTGRKWCHTITQHEVDALVETDRLMDFTHKWEKGKGWQKLDPQPKVTAEMVNAWSASGGIGHDAINRGVCVKARAQREGVWGLCEHCEGDGHVHTAPAAHVNLVLWWMHPRKGCTRGIEVKNIQKGDLPAVFAFLREAAERNARRFAKIPTRDNGVAMINMAG